MPKNVGRAPVTIDKTKCVIEVLSSKLFLTICSLALLWYVAMVSLVFYDTRSLRDTVLTDLSTGYRRVHDQVALEYIAYLKKFKKNYGSNEMIRRFWIYKESLKEIQRMNEEHKSLPGGAKFGPTFFSDISMDEWFHSGSNDNNYKECEGERETTFQINNSNSLPSRVDWRANGKVGPVLDQRWCNGCWAFGIIGVMESKFAILLHKEYTSLSIQELLDCVDSGNGCNGGHVMNGLRWLINSGPPSAVVTEDEYPLTLVNESCWLKDIHIKLPWYLKDYKNLCEPDIETILQEIADNGPVIAVVNPYPWQYYLDGIIQTACPLPEPGKMQHVVQIVGYDLNLPTPYYIIRNSWGIDFGDNGYIKVAIHAVDGSDNLCGIRNEIYLLYV